MTMTLRALALKQSDYRVVKRAICCFLVILLPYHIIINMHSLSEYEYKSGFASSIVSMKPRHYQYSKAFDQSFGFFTDISNQDWEKYSERFQNHDRFLDGDVRNNRMHLDSTTSIAEIGRGGSENGTLTATATTSTTEAATTSTSAHLFYQNNYNAEFTCPHEIQIGAHLDGRLGGAPKWLCDPHRILPMSGLRQQQSSSGESLEDNGCLVYIFSEEDPKQFVKDLNGLLEQKCEIHVFSKYLYNMIYVTKKSLGRNIHVHEWGLEGESDAEDGNRNYLTMGETLKKLNHVGRAIDILSIDCEGCEWRTYMDVLNADVSVTQLLIELHNAPYQVNDFFLEMRRHGFVIFHKEANTIDNNQGGQSQEYSFLRLSKDFFNA